MAVKIVTDSLSDITSDIAQGLGITVVPLTVSFGQESFLDRVTMTTDEFYHRLVHDATWPLQPNLLLVFLLMSILSWLRKPMKF